MQSAEALSRDQDLGSGSYGPAQFPILKAKGLPVAAKQFVASGTGLWLTMGYAVLLLGSIFSFGLLPLLALVGFVVEATQRKRIMARLKGGNLKVGADQLPELYECVRIYAERLNLKEIPDIYVVESNTINAFAFRVGSRNSIALIDDVIWGALQAGRPEALQFILAHELAHHALGHSGSLRFALSHSMFPLSRLDELSADAVALQLVGTREIAYEGLMMLTVGPQLLRYINRESLLRQSMEVGENKLSKKSERGLTHPLLLRRLYTLRNAPLSMR